MIGRTYLERGKPVEPFIPTPEMIAAAWGVLRDRWPSQPHLLGPGPGFREAIEAAFAKMPSRDPDLSILAQEADRAEEH